MYRGRCKPRWEKDGVKRYHEFVVISAVRCNCLMAAAGANRHGPGAAAASAQHTARSSTAQQQPAGDADPTAFE